MKINYSDEIVIGVSCATDLSKIVDDDFDSFIQFDGSYGYVDCGRKWKYRYVLSKYSELFGSGDIITISLNLRHKNGGVLSFAKNGKNAGIAFDEMVTDCHYRLAISMFGVVNSINILNMHYFGLAMPINFQSSYCLQNPILLESRIDKMTFG